MALAGSFYGSSQKYSLNQLNNLLVLTQHYLNFDTELLFKFNADELMVGDFKERVLPLLASVSSLTHEQIHRYGADLASLQGSDAGTPRSAVLSSSVPPASLLNMDSAAAPTPSSSSSTTSTLDEEGDKIRRIVTEINLIFSDEKYNKSNPHHVWAVLAKSVFMECNLFDHKFENYCISYDVRANMARIQFSDLVIQHLAPHLAFEKNGNTPKPFPELQAYISQQSFIYLIAQLHQLGHIQLGSALHNMLYLAKRCAMSRGSGMSTAQLAAVFSPVFIQSFGLFNKIYTVENGYAPEECVRIGRQYNLMSLIISNALTSDIFNFPYNHALERYNQICATSLTAFSTEMRDLPGSSTGAPQSLLTLILNSLPREEEVSRSFLTTFKELALGKKKTSPNMSVSQRRSSASELLEPPTSSSFLPSSSSSISVPSTLLTAPPPVLMTSTMSGSDEALSATSVVPSSLPAVPSLPMSTIRRHFGDGQSITRPLGEVVARGGASPRKTGEGRMLRADRDTIPLDNISQSASSSTTETQLGAESASGAKKKRPGKQTFG